MGVFYNPQDLANISDKYLIVDTNILAFCSTDSEFLGEFLKIFAKNIRLIDPVVRLEFLRGAQTDSLYQKKSDFLKSNEFYDITDHFDIFKKVRQDAEDISRIYTHFQSPDVPLGDLFITARLKHHYKTHLLLTLDQQDFTTLLFDRVATVSIESSIGRNKFKSRTLHHIVALKFNEEKFEECIRRIKK